MGNSNEVVANYVSEEQMDSIRQEHLRGLAYSLRRLDYSFNFINNWWKIKYKRCGMAYLDNLNIFFKEYDRIVVRLLFHWISNSKC